MKDIYILTTIFDDKKYYVIDLNGNLSRSIKDSMIFSNGDDAEQYVPFIERELIVALGVNQIVIAEKVNLLSIISETFFESIATSRNNN